MAAKTKTVEKKVKEKRNKTDGIKTADGDAPVNANLMPNGDPKINPLAVPWESVICVDADGDVCVATRSLALIGARRFVNPLAVELHKFDMAVGTSCLIGHFPVELKKDFLHRINTDPEYCEALIASLVLNVSSNEQAPYLRYLQQMCVMSGYPLELLDAK